MAVRNNRLNFSVKCLSSSLVILALVVLVELNNKSDICALLPGDRLDPDVVGKLSVERTDDNVPDMIIWIDFYSFKKRENEKIQDFQKNAISVKK